MCFRWCPWNWSLVEHPQEGHPILWEIHGTAKMLLLWLQVMSPCLFFVCSWILSRSAHWVFLTSLFLLFVMQGRTARSCLHAPVTWTEPPLPAVTEPRVRVSHRAREAERTRYPDQRLHPTPCVLRAGAAVYLLTERIIRVWYCNGCPFVLSND